MCSSSMGELTIRPWELKGLLPSLYPKSKELTEGFVSDQPGS